MYAGEWTQEQTLRLLSALEKHGEDWERVAEIVGDDKTEHECILHFLRMPIQDPFINNIHDTPFSSAQNPVMSLVTYLNSVLSPELAASAASAALAQIKGAPQDTNALLDDRSIAAAALAAAGERADVLAQKESHRIGQLLVKAIQLQLKGITSRMQKFQEVESFIAEKKAQLRRDMLKLLAEKIDSAKN